MKPITMMLACLLITTTFAGCLFGDDDPVSGCTDSDAVNYDSSADDDDGSCVMPVTQSELETAALAQLAAFETSRTNGEAYGVRTESSSDVQSDGDNVLTEITSIEIFDPGNDAMRYTYYMKLNGMEMIDYDVRQKGSIINVQSEDMWYLAKDEQPNAAELLAAIANEAKEGDEAEYTCDSGATVPISWVNDGTDDCFDGTDEGVTQEQIDAAIAEAAAGDSDILNQQEFDEMDWEMVVKDGYQSLISDDDENGTIYIHFDGDVQLVAFTIEVIDTDTDELGMEFENNVVTITFLEESQLNFDVSESHPPAASPFEIEVDYGMDMNLYSWDCDLVVHLAPGVNRTAQSLENEVNAANNPDMPEWCNETFRLHELDDLIDPNNSGDTSHWSNGFAWDARNWRVDGNHWVDFDMDIQNNSYLTRFLCDDGNDIGMNWVNDGVDDCSDGSDEGVSEQDVYNQTIVNCNGDAEYSQVTDTCYTNMTLSEIAMDQTYLNMKLVESYDYPYWLGATHWFAHESAYAATGNHNLSFVGTLTQSVDPNGLQPYAYVIEDEMNFQNSLDEFRLDLGYESMNDDGEAEFNRRISFDLNQMQSGSDQGIDGDDWAFVYDDNNENGYLDAGDSFFIYTNAGGAPTVKLYHNWGQGYTDESPLLLPGFTFLSTICLLGIAALNRRKD